MRNSHDFLFKVSVIGDGRVGKTSLIKRFTKGNFDTNYAITIGAQFSEYKQVIEGDKITLFFWDIAGQDNFHFVRPSFYIKSHAAIIVYSLEANKHGKQSYRNILNWYREVKQFCGDIPIVLFANKADLIKEKNLNKAKIQNLIDNLDLWNYYITSAKSGKGVRHAFNSLMENLYYQNMSLTPSY
ncbi:MAG: Rab family GTPase [Promethearchaeota archaeon]